MILMNTMPLGGPKRKIFAFEMSPARVKSGVWGQRKPDFRGSRHGNLSRSRKPRSSVSCMGRFPVTKKQPGIIETIGANMILDMWKPQYGSIRYHPDTECEH